jgi:hypothetical protein
MPAFFIKTTIRKNLVVMLRIVIIGESPWQFFTVKQGLC